MRDETWTVKRALDWTEGYLARKGDENPRASAQWLLCEACSLSRVALYTDAERPLSREELDVLHGWVARRGVGEPLQYITGETAFRYLTLKVARGVLIPRPETEVLVSEGIAALRAEQQRQEAAAWTDFAAAASARARAVREGRADSGMAEGAVGVEGAQASSPQVSALRADVPSAVPAGFSFAVGEGERSSEAASDGASSASRVPAGPVDSDDDSESDALDGILLDVEAFEPPAFEPLVVDLCTGSGCIACSVATEVPGARVIATDLAPEAVLLAQENARAVGVDDRVKVLGCDLGERVPQRFEGKVDLVISNPPYVPTAVMGEIPAEVRDFEPTLALDGGADGLDVFRRIVPFAARMLRPGGTMAVELHEEGMDRAVALAEAGGLENARVVKDLAGRPRVLVAEKPGTPAE